MFIDVSEGTLPTTRFLRSDPIRLADCPSFGTRLPWHQPKGILMGICGWGQVNPLKFHMSIHTTWPQFEKEIPKYLYQRHIRIHYSILHGKKKHPELCAVNFLLVSSFLPFLNGKLCSCTFQCRHLNLPVLSWQQANLLQAASWRYNGF